MSDFELDTANFKQDKGGITGKGYLLAPPPKSLVRRKHQDSATASNNLIRLISESRVADLQKAGFTARRLSPSEPRPVEGLIVSGVFTELDECNQMRRALLGFGSGKAKMQLYVMVADASHGDQRLYESSAQKNSGKQPASVIALNPYIGAAEVWDDEKCSRKDGQEDSLEDCRAVDGAAQRPFLKIGRSPRAVVVNGVVLSAMGGLLLLARKRFRRKTV